MDVREKMIELLGANTCPENDCCDDCVYYENEEACVQYLKASMADHLIANGVTVQEWISVEDRLPGFEIERVLVMINGDHILGYPKMDTDRYLNGGWVRYGDNVTHWMPLPQPPKGELG